MGGRPKGVPELQPRNTVAKKLAMAAAAGGITPLEVMLTAMRQDWEAAEKMLTEQAPEDVAEAEKWTTRIMKLRAAAIDTADRAAPYLHARLVATKNEHTGPNGGPIQTQDLREDLTAIFARAKSSRTETRH